MGNFKIYYTLNNGFQGSVVVAAVNKLMAWDMFADIAKDFNSGVVDAVCLRVVS